ncbi:MAG: PfkB family carbohydrate kinase [bacterium]|nr:PfkB family carbohydrate kinase [bacterium]
MKKKILIIGEGNRDIFVYCTAKRLAPDLPIPVLNIVEQKENPGMAKNVERNIKNIANICDIITNSDWESVTKTRYMHQGSNQAFFRVDANDEIKRVDVKSIPLDYEIIAISDYNKGFLTEEDIEYICDHHHNVIIDTKKTIGDWIKKAKIIKINDHEYERSKNFITKEIEERMIRTRGDLGARFQGRDYPVEKVEVRDVTGAGDSFFAAFLIKFSETNNVDESIKYANACASRVVQHRGVSVIEEILPSV